MKTCSIFLCFLFALFSSLHAEADLRYIDYVYLDNIRSVQFHLEGLLTSEPIIDLESPGALELSFDDLDGDVKNFTYTLIQCDADWKPTNLPEMEYLKGFSENRIRDYQYSFNTLRNYTHYKLWLPNDELVWTKSGNYLLVVYEDQSERKLAITRRLVVVENMVAIQVDVVAPAYVSKSRSHQEVDFWVQYEPKVLSIRLPQSEIKATVLQNGRWDNAVTNVPPLFSGPNKLSFDYQNKFVFAGGKEFRAMDLRSLRYRTESMEQILRTPEGHEVILLVDEKRGHQSHLSYNDLNGKFIIENLEEDQHDVESDYAETFISLDSPTEYHETDVYLFGGLTNWQLMPEYRMVYNPILHAHVLKVPLKQGFYNYYYAVVPKNAAAEFDETEGNSFETENDYTVLVYYRPFGTRYDRCIGAYTVSSRD